jgi:hypothetical protein
MPEHREDPLVRSGRREALVVMLIWFCAMMYTVLYCYFNGYRRPPETLTYILGFPDWVVFGILAPWAVCLVLSFWFGHVFMHDTELGGDPDEVAGSDGEGRNA